MEIHTPIHIAIERGYRAIIEKLLEHLDINVNIPNANGWIPLHLTVKQDRLESTSVLIV